MDIDICALIGYELKKENIKPLTGAKIEYETEYVGKVEITLSAYQLLRNDLLNDTNKYKRFLIAGICKNRTVNNLPPILIDSNFIDSGYKKENPPEDFEEKCTVLNKVLYQLYGKENREFELNTSKHFPLAYADPEEFTRIIDQLKTDSKISFRKKEKMDRSGFINLYFGVKVTNFGKEEAKKSLPKIPLFGLISQSITTGDNEKDEKLNHARELFFEEPQSLDKMRSACETLSYVLEPLREDLKNYFSSQDVSDFFQIVNKFDIRHNKHTTKKIVDPEQLEWIFYSLLNTINTYSKLKNRGK